MAHFKALKQDQTTINRCLDAIQTACSSELWLDSFIEASKKRNTVDNGHNVLLHWWPSFKETDIRFVYINRSRQDAAFTYEDANGVYIHIAEQNRRNSHVYRSNGIPEGLVQELEGKTHEELYEIIEDKFFKYVDLDDLELEITCIDNM